MEWIEPAIEAIVEILVALAPAMAGPSESAACRPKPHAAVEPDTWQCSDSAELASIFREKEAGRPGSRDA